MAKLKLSQWSWQNPGGFRAVVLSFALLPGVAFYSGNQLQAADLVPLTTPATASLDYQETDYNVINWSVSISSQLAPFNPEPPAAAGKVVRGLLNFGADASNSIPFIWQRDAGKLFLDLNRNRDFTDDAGGMFTARAEKVVYSQTTFTNVHLPFQTAQGRYQVLADLMFWDYSTRPSCNLSVRSFWQGKVTLQGQDWQAGIVPTLWGGVGGKSLSLENGELLLRPWEKRNLAFNTYDGSSDAFPFSRKIFVGGHAYQLDWLVGSPSSEVKPALRFTEQSVALGELKIVGQYIQRLILPGGNYLVVLDRPADSVKVPTGNYGQPNVWLDQAGTKAFINSSQMQIGKAVAVTDQTPAILAVGGPLTNSIIVSRHGQDLRLDYRLLGAGGLTYQLAVQNRSQPPEFAVFKGDQKIASGKFEFG